MCHPTCDDINSPRIIWIERDAQILNALFCVTGFGLAPWRFWDLYLLIRYRLLGDHVALRKLAGIHNVWFRLSGFDTLPAEVGPQTVATDSDSKIEDRLPCSTTKTPHRCPCVCYRNLEIRSGRLDDGLEYALPSLPFGLYVARGPSYPASLGDCDVYRVGVLCGCCSRHCSVSGEQRGQEGRRRPCQRCWLTTSGEGPRARGS